MEADGYLNFRIQELTFQRTQWNDVGHNHDKNENRAYSSVAYLEKVD